MMRMDWRRAEILDLICMYRESECLWNYLNPEYKDIDLKKNAWEEIANFFGRNVEEVKKKIKNLRTSYVLEKKKVDTKKISSGDSLYQPRLFYYDEMTFLDPIVVLRFFNPTEQSADPLSDKKSTRSTNDRHIAEKNKRKLFSSSDEDMPYSEPTPKKRLYNTHDVHLDNVPQVELEKEVHLSKEDTFCAMLCSELKLLKSEDVYDNVTSEIFTILRNAKMAERQIVYQPEEVNKVTSKKM
ncbi:uncharacterized protein LOC105214611 [Zeugodacus cucurbitae]|uniref:Chaperone protein DnaK n=1 Tax=Zeugodacus cucurbitae TaxID=28588 RepID=A0A0A1XM42_ZEUCU|nr:uncharacterized protein LOC105214611 [Zeugodacus cucurbitae]